MNLFKTSIILLLTFVFIGCQNNKNEENSTENQSNEVNINEEKQMPEIEKAIAVLYPTEGSEVNGMITFQNMPGSKVKVTAEVYNLTPGKHGFHVHENGDCSAEDGTSAGGHYFMENDQHGPLDKMETHIGDLGNLEADENGTAKTTFLTEKLTLNGIKNIIGRGIIVHAGEDDLKTQPTGGAGARVACGVIGITK